jgi:hypothetical protein
MRAMADYLVAAQEAGSAERTVAEREVRYRWRRRRPTNHQQQQDGGNSSGRLADGEPGGCWELVC